LGFGIFGLVVPHEHDYLRTVAGATSVLSLMAAVFYSDSVRAAAWMLGLAMAGRVFLELKLSLLKQFASTGELSSPGLAILLTLIYTCNFIAPALLLVEAIRAARSFDRRDA
jgi:hypothetical protein